MNYDFNFFYIWRDGGVLLEGLRITLILTAIAVIGGIFIGYLVAMMRMNSSRLLSWPATAFIEFFRCTPSLVQIVWFYYCLPIFVGLVIDPLTTVAVALMLNVSAFNAEAYRAAIQSVPSSHSDAAVALGLSPLQRQRYVIFPQAFRIAVPVLLTNSIGTFQTTSLVSLVAVADLMYQGRQLAVTTYRPIETLTTVAAIYLAASVVAGLIGRRYERRVARLTGQFG